MVGETTVSYRSRCWPPPPPSADAPPEPPLLVLPALPPPSPCCVWSLHHDFTINEGISLMPFADLHRFGRGATCRKFVARPRRAFSILQHLGPGRALAQRRAPHLGAFSLAASCWTTTITSCRFYRERQLKEGSWQGQRRRRQAVKRAHSQRASREAGPRAGGVVQVLEGSGPTIAGGERSEPPCNRRDASRAR